MATKEYTYEEICAAIRARKFSPVYGLMGEEPYFIDQITALLMDTVLTEEERDFNQLVLYGADTDAVAVINAARRYPMMAEHQLIVIREAQQMRDIETLSVYVKQPLASTILVLNYKYKTLDKRKSLAGMIAKQGILFESKKMPEYKMPAFIGSVFQQRKLAIDAKATQMLSDCVGNDLTRLDKEISKLEIIVAEKGLNRVTPELVEEHVGISKEYNNFELLRAVAGKDVLKTNRIIQYFAKNPKNNPLQVTLSVLFNYFSNLLICYYTRDRSESGLMAALGLRGSFQLKDYQTGMRNYPPMKVFNLIGTIREADARSKGIGNVSLGDADILKELLYKILH